MIMTKSKLLKKGLVVIILPTVFQLLFLGLLAVLLFEAQQEMQKTIESKKVVATASKVVARIIDTELLSMFYFANKTSIPFLELKFSETKQKAEESCIELKRLCATDKKRSQYADTIEKSSHRTLERLARVFSEEEFKNETDLSKYVGTDRDINKVSKLFTMTFKDVDQLIDSEHKRQKAVKKNQKYYGKMIKNVIIGGVALNVVLTFLLAIFLTTSTTARLKTVLNNTQRLRRREPLAAPIGGDDEITQLDKVFHATANDLRQVDKQRRQLVQLVRNELSMPLNKVRFSLHNLSQGILGELSEKAQNRLTLAAVDTDRVIRLIDDLLSIEDMEGGSFDLILNDTTTTDVINSAVSSVKQLAERNSIQLEIKDQKVSLVADRDRLVQVLINFLSNGIKFSPEGESITVAAIDNSDHILFEVTDRGRGIPLDKQGDVFERFKQVEDSDQVDKGGTGLGLPISKTIIEQHEGEIGVTSTLGEGSTFWFKIPT